ncbi:MAG: UPF0182 family protein, partial [Patescibacteria group bacterium]|nr:UPF0182 family protein [Patescibacteria group bacterium]
MNIIRLSFWIFFIIVFVGLALFSNVVNFVTDWWWFSELGFSQVFLKSLGTKVGLFTGTVTFISLFLFLNLSLAIRSKVPWVTMLPQALIGQVVNLDSKIARKLAIVFSLVVGLFLGMVVMANWQEVLKYSFASEFGILDPIFGKDIGFYLFFLPVYKIGLDLIKMLIFLCLSGSVLVYFLRGRLSLNMKPRARVHLSVLLAVFLALMAVGSYLSIFGLLVTQSDPVFGAVYTDIVIRVPLIWALVFTALLSSVSALYWGFKGHPTPLIGAFSLYLLVGLSMLVVPFLVDKLVVAPNQLVKETPYIEHNIKATNQAFGLNEIEE